MASIRRPSSKAGTPAPAAKAGGSDGTRPDVISASKSAGAKGKLPGAAGTWPPADNVVSFPEPKAKRRRRLLVNTIGVLVVLVVGIVAAAVYSPVLALRTVTVHGTTLLSPDQVQAALAPLHGKPLPQISEEDVAALLQPLVQVTQVTTQAHLPSTLQVHVRERVPVALVKQGASFELVDVEGVELGTAPDPAAVQLPVIAGGAGPLPKDLFRAITGVLGALPADVLARLSEASAKSEDAVELKLVDGQTVIWGNAGEKELKARVLAALLRAPANPQNPVKIYDVSVPRHPVTR
ncbi:MAG: FtsQ-type protein [Arthrobacter sp.]|nr:FtsQ-type protein [Arthrobacter sp.]